ncbi:hypothetical protein [Lactobacillus delbrueckii]|jgi:hypothetical protein|uniref:hypothetical protein n=1 Tax=Lactobacillus delbrueckii TaxID=1584 RepID=UPI001E4AE2A2|nr:hypothetical protein [Lactobacillus delbrueckii]MCD5491597.1 hypothetical protein [Lactobacillus delbrueckii subsp. lactis]
MEFEQRFILCFFSLPTDWILAAFTDLFACKKPVRPGFVKGDQRLFPLGKICFNQN